jgi:hypothetical protein
VVDSCDHGYELVGMARDLEERAHLETKQMETSSNKKYFERVVSQKALQMGSSFPCQICVVGFLCGVCLTSLFLAVLTSFGSLEFGGISFSAISVGGSPWNSSSEIISMCYSLSLSLCSSLLRFFPIFFFF